MAPKVERVEEIGTLELGEGPHWDAGNQCLYFVDIFGKAIHKYVPETKKHTKAVIGSKPVSLIIPVKDQKDKFLISIGRELAVVTWDGKSEQVSKIEKILEVENTPDKLNNIFNDGKCDETGRLWAGTINPKFESKEEDGALYSFHKKEIIKQIPKVGLSNGLAWNNELKKFYYIDTQKEAVTAFDFDSTKGTISNGQTIFTLKNVKIVESLEEGVFLGLDGMAIDVDGNLWIAVFNSFKVIKIDPRKTDTLLDTIEFPAKQVTSVAFGGKNLDELYVTSGKKAFAGNDLPEYGGIYKVTDLNTKGYAGVNVEL